MLYRLLTARPKPKVLAWVVFTGCLLLPTGISSQLQPTLHAPLPAEASDLWLVPSASDRSARSVATYRALSEGVERYRDGDYAAALALVTRPSLAWSWPS